MKKSQEEFYQSIHSFSGKWHHNESGGGVGEWYGGFSVELISHHEISLPAYQETDGDEHDDCGGLWWDV